MRNTPLSCSEISRSKNEPLIGTAIRVDVWLMLEYRDEWRAEATEDNELPRVVRDWLEELQAEANRQGLMPRLQFIRSERRVNDPLTFFLAKQGNLYRYECSDYNELVGTNPLTDAIEPLDETHYFVCANGQRDLCCSRLGMAAYRSLRELCNGRTWRTTHLGGHRFAPNILVLPDNLLYGRVVPPLLNDFVASAEHGEIYKPFLRGRGNFSPEEQVCELRAQGAVREIQHDGNGTYRCLTDLGVETFAIQPPTTLSVLASCGDSEEKLVPIFNETV